GTCVVGVPRAGAPGYQPAAPLELRSPKQRVRFALKVRGIYGLILKSSSSTSGDWYLNLGTWYFSPLLFTRSHSHRGLAFAAHVWAGWVRVMVVIITIIHGGGGYRVLHAGGVLAAAMDTLQVQVQDGRDKQ